VIASQEDALVWQDEPLQGTFIAAFKAGVQGGRKFRVPTIAEFSGIVGCILETIRPHIFMCFIKGVKPGWK
jgi:hypothetical protein